MLVVVFYYMWVCYCAFRKEYFDDCDDERKIAMYPNGDHIFVREANQKSGKSLAWNSQQHFLLSSPGPTKDTEKQVYR